MVLPKTRKPAKLVGFPPLRVQKEWMHLLPAPESPAPSVEGGIDDAKQRV